MIPLDELEDKDIERINKQLLNNKPEVVSQLPAS